MCAASVRCDDGMVARVLAPDTPLRGVAPRQQVLAPRRRWTSVNPRATSRSARVAAPRPLRGERHQSPPGTAPGSSAPDAARCGGLAVASSKSTTAPGAKCRDQVFHHGVGVLDVHQHRPASGRESENTTDPNDIVIRSPSTTRDVGARRQLLEQGCVTVRWRFTEPLSPTASDIHRATEPARPRARPHRHPGPMPNRSNCLRWSVVQRLPDSRGVHPPSDRRCATGTGSGSGQRRAPVVSRIRSGCTRAVCAGAWRALTKSEPSPTFGSASHDGLCGHACCRCSWNALEGARRR